MLDETTPLVQRADTRVIALDGSSDHNDRVQAVSTWVKKNITPVVVPQIDALNATTITSTMITLFKGDPPLEPKVVGPLMYAGLLFNTIGFADGLARAHGINEFNRLRHWYRAVIAGLNTFCFSEQFLIAILVDICANNGTQFDVGDWPFVGITAGPALLGIANTLVHGFDVKRPSELHFYVTRPGDWQNLKNILKYAALALLELANNASTAHTFIQIIATLTHPLTTPKEQLIRYTAALTPPLLIEVAQLYDRLPQHWFSSCMQNCNESLIALLREVPEQLFLFISALNYGIFIEEIYRNKGESFSALGLALQQTFWVFVFLLPILIRLNGGLTPSEENGLDIEEGHYAINNSDTDSEDHLNLDSLSEIADRDSTSPDSQAERGTGVVQQQPLPVPVAPGSAAVPKLPVRQDLPLPPGSAPLTRSLSIHAEMGQLRSREATPSTQQTVAAARSKLRLSA